jgi:ankyrin repeat protein
VLLAAAPELLRASDDSGRTCLHVAVAARRVRVVESLLGLDGARLLAMRCRRGQTPLDMSVAMGESTITALLRAHQ